MKLIVRSILFTTFILFSQSGYTAAFVTTNAAGPPTVSFFDMKFWQNAVSTSAAGSAVATSANNASLTTALGKSVPLPANFAASIPRATLAQSAAKILVRGTAVGLAGFALYDLLHSHIGLNADGSLTSNTYTRSGTGCWGHSPYNFTGTTAQYVSYWITFETNCFAQYQPGWTSTVTVVSDGVYHETMFNASGVQQFSGNATLTLVGSTQIAPADSDLSSAIQNSPATESQIFDRALKDSVDNGIDFGTSGLMTPATPLTSNAIPVVGPEEVISTEQISNPDGTTSTRTTKNQTTATPVSTGTTIADKALEWQTSDKTTTTTVNNTTNVTTTTTTNTNYGSSTTQQPQKIDWGSFVGSNPGDGFVDGKAMVNTSLCGGNCSQALNCSTGSCTIAERINAIKTKYAVAPIATGICPAIDMDLSAQFFGAHHVTEHCDLAESVRGIVATIFTILTAIGVITIIMSA